MKHEDMPKDIVALGVPAGSVKFEFIIGLHGGSCITKVHETNRLFNVDLNDMGAFPEDLLSDDGCDGDKYPVNPGKYLFDGHTYDFNGLDDHEWHTPGKIILISQLESE